MLKSNSNSSSSSDLPLMISPLTSAPIELFSVVRSKPHLQMSFDRNCNADLQNRFWTLFNYAASFTNYAYTYLTKANCDSHYVTYFGQYQSSARWSLATRNFLNIKTNLDRQLFSITCEQNCNQYVVAFVYPNDRTHLIHLCPWLYQQDLNFQGATFVHELSHYDDIAATRDHVYGDAQAIQLARNFPDKALNNAENHGFFARARPTC